MEGVVLSERRYSHNKKDSYDKINYKEEGNCLF
jgi:hypothetical protein